MITRGAVVALCATKCSEQSNCKEKRQISWKPFPQSIFAAEQNFHSAQKPLRTTWPFDWSRSRSGTQSVSFNVMLELVLFDSHRLEFATTVLKCQTEARVSIEYNMGADLWRAMVVFLKGKGRRYSNKWEFGVFGWTIGLGWNLIDLFKNEQTVGVARGPIFSQRPLMKVCKSSLLVRP